MDWPQKILLLIKSKRRPISEKLDLRLLKKTQTSRFPRLGQIKYLPRFLNKTEKLAVKICLTLVVLASLGWIGTTLSKNHITIPAEGGEYSEALVGQPEFINPLFSDTNDVDSDLVSLIYSSLFKHDKDGRLVSDLAAGYTVSEDQKTYEISLREDAKWSDGSPLTANDVIYTFNAIQDAIVNSPLFPSFQSVKIEKIDDYNVRFTLKEPYAPFINSLTVGILPQHIWSAYSGQNIKLAKENFRPIASGPWKFSKMSKDSTGNLQSYTLARNENYYGQKPYLKTLIFKFYPDYVQALEALKTQEVSALNFLPKESEKEISKNNFNFYDLNLPQYTALFFNKEKAGSLKDDNLREALLLSTDKQQLLQEVLDGKGQIINSPILDIYQDYQTATTSSEYNPDKATELLDKTWKKIEPEDFYDLQYEKLLKNREDEINKIKEDASSTPEVVSSTIKTIEQEIAEQIRGSMNSEQPFYRQSKDGDFLELNITTVNTPEYTKAAEAIAKMWRKNGIKVNTLLAGTFQIKDILKERNYQILLYGEIVGDDPDPYPFWHSSQVSHPGLNLSLFSDREADKILEQARAASDTSERNKLYLEFQNILLEENPAIFLYTPKHTFAINKQIKGVEIKNVFYPSDRYADSQNWHIKTKTRLQLTSS